VILAGWGRYPRVDCRVLRAEGSDGLGKQVAAEPSLIARGNGRAYGDAAMNPAATLSMLGLDRLLAFDAVRGEAVCEAGMLLSDLIGAVLPRGWFPPVVPGTQFVTLGGMVAADIHGKNHHAAGTLRHHIAGLTLVLADGSTVACSPLERPELFDATCGGMGLTGIIATVTLRLLPVETAWMRQETVVAPDLDAAMALFEASARWRYSVAWIDCLATGAARGRSVFLRAEHAAPADLPAARRARPLDLPARAVRRLPPVLPPALLNRWTARAFNAVYYRRARAGERIVRTDSFFFPLDALRDWNRLYGAGGLLQYQCVLPKAASRRGLASLLDAVARSGQAPFLTVLKLFGAEDGLMSFPMEGYTLAMDFPRGRETLQALDGFDRIVTAHGGRLYLAKDARMDAPMLRGGYPGLDRFRQIRATHGAVARFDSLLARRVGL